MTDRDAHLGGRLPLADPQTLSDAARRLYDDFQSSWIQYAETIGVRSTTEDGRLIGPFNAFLLHPELTAKLSDLQVAEAAHTTLAPRVREVAILATGAVWRADYELYAHVSVAGKLGLSPAAITALSQGEIPDDLSEDEQLAAQFSFALLRDHQVDDALYGRAEASFGPVGIYDLLTVMGVYQTVCSMLALFEVPAPS